MTADVGIPMVFVQVATMAMALVPVILAESIVVRWKLGQPFGITLWNTGVANLASTVFGIPLAWVAMLIPELIVAGGGANLNDLSSATLWHSVFYQAAWLPPYGKPLAWMIPAASLMLLPLAFALSVLIEGQVLATFWPSITRARVLRASLLANVVSYVALVAVEVFRLRSNLH